MKHLLVIILVILLVGYMIYGVVHAVKNKSLNRSEKAIWIIIIFYMPVLGAALYLRSTFKVRN